jgi:dolichol-phosphate mannosyltransferase
LYNESSLIPSLFEKLNSLKSELHKNTEIILIDDGSKDKTFEDLKKTKLNYSVQIIKFSRNFGHQAALLAGLETAKGDIVVTMDGDLQHPPELIPEMLKHHSRGVDIVITQRIDGVETSQLKKLTALGFYTLLNSISSRKINPNSSDFRSMSRKGVDALLSLPEKRKFLRGMVPWIGFSQITIPFQVQKRVDGESKYSSRKMIKLAIEGITSFSTSPLYASAFIGLMLFMLAAVYAIYVLYIRFGLQQAVEGWASVLFVLLIVGGFLSLFLGIIGLYLAAIYDEVKQRPIYIIDQNYVKKFAEK